MSEEKKRPDSSRGDKDKKAPKSPKTHGGSDPGFPLIGGGGLLRLLEEFIPLLGGLGEGEEADEINPFESLDDSDFDPHDAVIEQFKNDLGGCGGVVKIVRMQGPDAIEKLSEVTDQLRHIRTAQNLQRMREVFSSIHAAKQGQGRGQLVAVALLQRLASDATTAAEQRTLLKAREAVLAGEHDQLDAAAFRVQKLFAATLPSKPTRLAYTSLSTQDGEGYLLCPKAKKQLGHAVPMELSKCQLQ